jgi:hypothetical protein
MMQQPPIGFMMSYPGSFGGGMNPYQRGPEIVVPARVDKAMEFLQLMTAKVMPRAAATDHSIEQLPVPKLTTEEESCHATACNLLSTYFDGKLKPDEWEKTRLEADKKMLDTGGKKATLLTCFACMSSNGPHAAPNPKCQLCEGTGKIMVSPSQTTP